MKLVLFTLLILMIGCASSDVTSIYHDIDEKGDGVKDTFENTSTSFIVHGVSHVSEANSVTTALYRAKELWEGEFTFSEKEVGVIITTHCSNCGFQYFYEASVTCEQKP